MMLAPMVAMLTGRKDRWVPVTVCRPPLALSPDRVEASKGDPASVVRQASL